MLTSVLLFENWDFKHELHRFWKIYQCGRCGGVVSASSDSDMGVVKEIYPQSPAIDESIPDRARSFLIQAIDTIHAPSGSVMLCASAVDAMLKAKEYKEGSLYSRIDKARDDHLITADMAAWAHAVRLDANDQRHADESASLPNEVDAQRSIDFVMALAQFLFVLPARIKTGLASATTP
jgi:hypothetical protein